MSLTYADVRKLAEANGINPKTLWNRIQRGMDPETAIHAKPGGPYAGVTAASKRTQIPASTLVSRINAGKTLDEAVAMGIGTSVTDGAVRMRRKRGDASVRPAKKRQSGVAKVARETGLSKQRVSELMGQGVSPDDIERMRAKQETPRERRERIDAANQKDWTEMAVRQAGAADRCWVESFVRMMVGWFGFAAKHAEDARSYERTATWWADKAIGQWCSVCEKKHPPPMHNHGDQRY